MSNKRLILLPALLICLQACSSVVTDPIEGSDLVETCQQLVQPAYLVNVPFFTKGGFIGGRLIIPEEYSKNYANDIVGYLSEGTKFKIRHTLKDQNMFVPCWRIEVEIASGEFKDMISELPACYVSHPPSWLNSIGPPDPSLDKLKIKPEYAVPCLKN